MVTNTKARGCAGKRAYATREDAEAHMWRLVRSRGAALSGLNVYDCRFCAGFHVGHRPRGRRR